MDQFKSFRGGLESPYTDWFQITPDDDNDLPQVPRLVVIWDSAGGDVVVVSESGSEMTMSFDTWTAADIRPVRVKATGTTATKIWGLV